MIRDKQHLEFIRKLPCVKCGSAPADAAHVRKGTDGGTGLKPSDCWTVPLCRQHHNEQHQVGEDAFWGDTEKARQLARNLWLLSGFNGKNRDIYAAINLICVERVKCFL